jgi:hypothetical protein
VTVALKMYVRAARSMSGSPDVWKAPIETRPADSIIVACIVAKMMGPYCVGNERIAAGNSVVRWVIKRRRLNMCTRYAAAFSVGTLTRLSARLPTLMRWISSKKDDPGSPLFSSSPSKQVLVQGYVVKRRDGIVRRPDSWSLG